MKAKRLQSRTVEKEQRRLHVPVIDRAYGEPPPFVIVVQGPPQVFEFFLFVYVFCDVFVAHSCLEALGKMMFLLSH